MSTKRPDTNLSDATQPNEIPTAVMEHQPFSDESHTSVEEKTADGGTPTPSDATTPGFRKLRRPTESEIARAVDQVNTESVDMDEVHQARAAALEDEDDEDEGAEDDDVDPE